KVYRDHELDIDLTLSKDAAFRGDPTDLMEILGNLLDNAFKHARHRLALSVRQEKGVLRLEIDDDGPGIPAEIRDEVLQRGMRGDESVAGQGIGFAAAEEIISAYGGRLDLDDSPLGGARVVVSFPMAT
ncbi:MAG TPA: GHKL domain-containing protein, partial [Chromatiales bacterium]|nr:GHKL domain-containing protein [Chromatiales bacterium]